MEAVNAFNHELFSLMDTKPPISRAKMISITKSAIKAMKLYKHVVQIVEKFIKKCKPEFKVAGLYVVDSIVRQSRHQFGADKDVFGPRFTKNILGTFENLCLCPVEDRSKLVRVLNLWQKNGVFQSDIIQPLLDMAAGSGSAAASFLDADDPVPSPAQEPISSLDVNPTMTAAPQLQHSEAFAAVAQLFQSTQGQQLQQMLQHIHQQPSKPESTPQPPVQTFPVQVQQQFPPPSTVQPSQQKSAFDKILLDRFDYDDEPDAGEEAKKEDVPSQSAFAPQPQPVFTRHMENLKPLSHQLLQQSQPPFAPNGQAQGYGLPPGQGLPHVMPHAGQAALGPPPPASILPPTFAGGYHQQSTVPQQQDMERAPARDGRHGGRSHSGSRSPKRRRSRSNSRTRRPRHRRSRSRSRDRRHHSPRSRSQERREREKERERRQKGLPPPRKDSLSVCSTTLWVGQLDKRTQQQDVASLLEEFGQIDSVNMIPPRGCAYIVMVHRQDAYRALQKLGRGSHKVNQKAIKIAWALNKGIKPEFKQYWDVDVGATYIPWMKVKEEQLDELKDGAMLDADTLSPEWTATKSSLRIPEQLNHNGGSEQQLEEVAPPAQVLPPAMAVAHLQPPVFPGPLPPPSYQPGVVPLGLPPGVPPGVPPPFLRPGFSPMQMPPGFLPLGAMSLGLPPPSKSGGEDAALMAVGLANRKMEDGPEIPSRLNHQMGPMGTQVAAPPGGPPGNIQHLPTGLLGARPGLIPLQRPPGPAQPHMQRFPPPPPPPPGPGSPISSPQMMLRAPHPPIMHHEGPPPKPFPPPAGPPPFIRPAAPCVPDGSDQVEARAFRGEPERDWDRDRGRDRGFGGGRRPFGDGGRGGVGGDRADGRERLGGWQDDGAWERDRYRERRDWRDRRNSLDGERDGGRADGGERGRGERDGREQGREGERPKRSERRERTTRWDKDDRLAELESMDQFRTPDKADADTQAGVAEASQPADK
ncbi:SR-related and CTD-associated factor 4 isoform X1 [Synchiropus splendidus]|uniref:SR-related and CTD-associated factor 4 isoform X1 n=1 Tax=Synchiropus splendidus TaxID=270530 RepID=UPI00237E24D4|nr:SR-related and CTD-associated factor 4 isoform X1 [Synchiropus splendidus]